MLGAFLPSLPGWCRNADHRIKTEPDGTVFKDASNYEWKVGFTYKNMTIYCDKCHNLDVETPYPHRTHEYVVTSGPEYTE